MSQTKSRPVDALVMLKETTLIPDSDETPQTVTFGEGRLGVQIADINGRILVSCFEDNPDGTPGQAQRSGIVKFASQIVAVNSRSVVGMNIKELRKLVAQAPRPIDITFQKMKTSSGAELIAPPNITVGGSGAAASSSDNGVKRGSNLLASKTTDPNRARLIEMIRDPSKLETAGSPYSVRFRQGMIGLKIANAGTRVLVSGFERGPKNEMAQAERVKTIQIGDQLIAVGNKSCLHLDYRGCARLVASAERPVVLTFVPIRYVGKDQKARVMCYSCSAVNWNSSTYCRMCGEPILSKQDVMAVANQKVSSQSDATSKDESDLIDLSFDNTVNTNDQQQDE